MIVLRACSTHHRRVKNPDETKASKANPSLPATVEMQHSDLRFITTENDLHHCTLNFMIAAFDEDGTQLSGVSMIWTSDLSRQTTKTGSAEASAYIRTLTCR